MSRFHPRGLGWQRDLPDPRDFTSESRDVSKLLRQMPRCDESVPTRVDLRSDDEGCYLSEPGDQGSLHSSSAHACIALVEYFERRVLGSTFEGSAYFLYAMSKRLAGASGNCSIGLRTTLKALKRYGVPPEEMVPYRDTDCDSIPLDISLLGFSRDLEEMHYFRLDPASRSASTALQPLRATLHAGLPVVLGFPVPRSLGRDGAIPFRPKLDSYRGGQSVLAVGFDDDWRARGHGAILIRSSWGTQWGESGYGWLPYSFVNHRLAVDMWTIVRPKWCTEGIIQRPNI